LKEKAGRGGEAWGLKVIARKGEELKRKGNETMDVWGGENFFLSGCVLLGLVATLFQKKEAGCWTKKAASHAAGLQRGRGRSPV